MDESHSANHQIFVVVLWPLLLVERVCCLDLTTREYNDFRAENQLISRMNCDCSVIDPVLEGNRNARLAIYLPTLRFFSLSKWYFSRLSRRRFAQVTRSFLKCSVARTRSRAHWGLMAAGNSHHLSFVKKRCGPARDKNPPFGSSLNSRELETWSPPRIQLYYSGRESNSQRKINGNPEKLNKTFSAQGAPKTGCSLALPELRAFGVSNYFVFFAGCNLAWHKIL